MLCLPMQARGDLVLLPDHIDPARVYVALARPRLSSASAEHPSLRLIAWQASEAPRAGEREVGGHLFLEIEVEPSVAELTAAGLDNRTVVPMPWVAARAVLHAPGVEPITSEVSVVAGGRAAFGVRLSPLQVERLAPLLRGDVVSPLQVTWEGQVRARMPAAEVVATVDVAELREEIATRTLTSIHTQISAHARVKIVGSTSPEVEAALRAWALAALAEQVANDQVPLVRSSAADVVAWPLRLSSTLDLDLEAGARSQRVTMLALPPDELETPPPVRIQARGGFADGVERVDVELREGDGEPVTVALVSETAAWVAFGRGALTWRHRVVVGGTPRPWSRWRDAADLRELTIPVVALPARVIEVLLGGIDLATRWASARIELSAADPAGGVRSHVIEMREDLRAGTWTLPTGLEGAVVLARVTLVSRQGLQVEQEPVEVEHDQVVVRDPFGHHRIALTVVPVGSGWDEVALVMVDLRHEDGEWIQEQAVELQSLASFVLVELPARDPSARTIAWRVHASLADGRFVQSPWSRGHAPLVMVAIPTEAPG